MILSNTEWGGNLYDWAIDKGYGKKKKGRGKKGKKKWLFFSPQNIMNLKNFEILTCLKTKVSINVAYTVGVWHKIVTLSIFINSFKKFKSLKEVMLGTTSLQPCSNDPHISKIETSKTNEWKDRKLSFPFIW